MSDMDAGLDGRLAQGTHVNGTLKFDKALQIDGRFEGKVKSKGKLILGKTAQVNADIDVGELEVNGELRGKVLAKNRLLIRDGGKLEGNVTTDRLAIESGAIFRGGCEMPDKDASGGGATAPGAKQGGDAKPSAAPEKSAPATMKS